MIKKAKKSREEKIVERRNELAKKEKVAAIWTRVSSKDQYNKNCSIESQIEGCRAYCERNHIRIKKEFGGKNESAKKAGELFMDMIGEVLNDPEYNTVVVFDFDRFSRDSDDGIIYKSKVKRCGISVKSVNQPIDEKNVLADQIENILIIIADIDNAMRRHKCHRGMVDCINKGEWYSRTTLGYDKKKVDKKHIITVNKDGRILKNAFEWIVNEPEISQYEITQRLRNMGLNITKQHLSSILRNSFYCGRIEHKYLELEASDKPYIMGVQEPLISEEMFDKVQQILAGNHCNYEHQEETPNFPLKKFVHCAKDGKLMTGYTTKNKDYYKCAVKGCKTNVSADEMHSKYSEMLNKYHISKELETIFTKVLEKKFQEKEGMNYSARTNLNKNLETLNTKMKNVTIRYATGDIEKDVYEVVRNDLISQISKTEQELEKINQSFSNLSKYIGNSFETASKLGYYWNKKDFKLCQKIQKLTFPNGVKWDGEHRCFRTDGENEFLAIIANVGASVGGSNKKEQDKSCDLSCLVAGAGLEPTTSGL